MERRVDAVEVPVVELVEESHLSTPRRSVPRIVFAAAAGDENEGCDRSQKQAKHRLIFPDAADFASLKPRRKTSITLR
jgi:hypothetical protein